MREYFPDRWVIIKVEGTDVPETYYRVFGSWYGGYTSGDSWKMSSGIESVSYDPANDQYTMPQSSGSTYKFYKSNHGMSGYAFNVYRSYEALNSDACRISIMDENFDLAAALQM